MKTLGLILTVLALAACHKNGPPAQCPTAGIEPSNSQTRIISFGDSQTEGCASAVNGKLYSWAWQMSGDLNKFNVDTAVNGSLFTDNVESGVALNFQYQPSDTIVMLIGFNDMEVYGTDSTHLAEFQAELVKVLQYQSPLVQKIVIGTCLHPLRYRLQGSDAAVDLYREATRAGAAGFPNVSVIDVDGSFAGNPEMYLSADGTHIVPAAQKIVAGLFEQQVSQ